MAEPFRVGFAPTFFGPDGESLFGPIGLELLDEAGVEWVKMPPVSRPMAPDDIAGYDAVALLSEKVTPETLAGNDRLAVIARYGVGYDLIDVPACTEAGVLLTITPEGVRRPMAMVNLTFLLALSHRLLEQDRLIRAGRWAEKASVCGVGLAGKTLGTIGLGNIAREFIGLTRPFGMRVISFDPYATPDLAAEHGVELVDLETLLRQADFVTIACALTPETHHLLNAERLALMKPTAYLISTARGPIVDQAALTEALREKRIAGAGLDVFEQEPVDPNDPILQLDNVILSPHNLCLTDEWASITGRQALGGVLEVAAGKVPPQVVNRAVEASPKLAAKLARYQEQRS